MKTRSVLGFFLWAYIALCLVIAGLNFGLAPRADEKTAHLIHLAYEIFENEFKTSLILVCGLVSLFAIREKKKNIGMRGANIVGFFITALIIHVLLPLGTGNREIYYTAMPMPWSTTGLQLMDETSSFYSRHIPLWGLSGISSAVVLFVFMNVFVLIGTFFFGRRLQCSTLCLLNGFVAEIWAPVFPLAGKKPALRGLRLTAVRLVFFAGAIFFTAWWLFSVIGMPLPGNANLIASIEVYKYLSLELIMMMAFWVFWTGRGYCHYCPLGTTLSIVARLGKQAIRTDRTGCVSCLRCDAACPMSIQVSASAKTGAPVTDSLCVGCGHCVDACPKRTLGYTTAFLARFTKI